MNQILPPDLLNNTTKSLTPQPATNQTQTSILKDLEPSSQIQLAQHLAEMIRRAWILKKTLLKGGNYDSI